MGFRSGDREQVFAQLDVSCRPKYIQISISFKRSSA
jgi:hypothetical protein